MMKPHQFIQQLIRLKLDEVSILRRERMPALQQGINRFAGVDELRYFFSNKRHEALLARWQVNGLLGLANRQHVRLIIHFLHVRLNTISLTNELGSIEGLIEGYDRLFSPASLLKSVMVLIVYVVPRDRIELSTPAFSGLCSTN
jgi:hypothetical protein